MRINDLDGEHTSAGEPQDDPTILFIPGSYEDCEDPAYCGAEYLFHDVGTSTDSAVYWMRGQWRVRSYYAVAGIEGPAQGSFSVSLRAVPISDVTS